MCPFFIHNDFLQETFSYLMPFISRLTTVSQDCKPSCQTIRLLFSPLSRIRPHCKSAQNIFVVAVASHSTLSSTTRDMSSRYTVPRDWVKPLVVEPYSQPHKQTLIILHGRGDWAHNFAPVLLQMPLSIPSSKPSRPSHDPSVSQSQISYDDPQSPSTRRGQFPSTLQSVLPHTKFIFLTAPMRSCTMINGEENRQWFDNFSLINPEMRQDLQVAGLQETVQVVHRLLRDEAKDSAVLGKARQLALMGFSQGAAATLISGLLWDDKSENSRPADETTLVAVVSMSGWLPFRRILDEQEANEVYKLANRKKVPTGLTHLRHFLGIDQATTDGQKELENKDSERLDALPTSHIPAVSILLCHGKEDIHVDPSLSRTAAKSLLDLGVIDVVTREFDELGHFVNAAEIGEVAEFLREKFGEINTI